MDIKIAHSEFWALAVLMIVVASWFLYRYMVPKTWREWAGAGLVQAFIIALYAEMYGFPLTIYLLVRFFHLDRTNLSANLWSTLLGMGETGMLISMLIGYALLFVGIGLFAQGWRELYRAHQQNKLAVDGLYSLVRHPQYTGLFIGLFGEGVVHWPTVFSIILFPLIVLVYTLLAYREERRMLELFGEQYRIYMQRVPMFFPGRTDGVSSSNARMPDYDPASRERAEPGADPDRCVRPFTRRFPSRLVGPTQGRSDRRDGAQPRTQAEFCQQSF